MPLWMVLTILFFTHSLYCQQETTFGAPALENTFMCVSSKRIEEKKAAWRNQVTMQYIKRGALYSAGALLVLWSIYKIWWQSAAKNSQQDKQQTKLRPHQQLSDLEYRTWLYEQEQFKNSVKRVFLTTFLQGVSFALAGACVTLLMSAATKSGSVFFEQFKQIFGFGQENVSLDIINNSMYSCRQLAKSIEALPDEINRSTDKAFQDMWYKSIMGNVIIYHFAFTHAFEEWAAHISVLLETKGCEPSACTAIQQSILTITAMISMVIKKENDMVNTQNFSKETTEEISYMLRGICQEITECSYQVGCLCYDHAFSLEKP
jgi:hypothetical protein